MYDIKFDTEFVWPMNIINYAYKNMNYKYISFDRSNILLYIFILPYFALLGTKMP